MFPAARSLDERIAESGAVTVFFLTWGRRDGLPAAGYADFDAMQAELEVGYETIARELDATVAPVGLAWQRAVGQDPTLDLWQSDGSHPTEEGTYLAACVLYATIFGEGPEGLAYTAGVAEDTALALQAVAAGTVVRPAGQ